VTPEQPEGPVTLAGTIAERRVVHLHVPPPRSAETFVWIRRVEQEPEQAVFRLEDGRSTTQHVLVAVRGTVMALLPGRPSVIVMRIDHLHVRRMLCGHFVSRATSRAWSALQQAFGFAAAVGAQIFLVHCDQLLALNELA
jgi:hypothetical protein